tara:strand:- start:886 stop:1062 length:177 start_codon:yes stop_codon:yes gene_type:complete
LAAQLQDEYQAEVSLEKGRGGVFDVWLNDQLVFSKHSVSRFPEDGEIQSAVNAHLAAN